MTQYDVQSITGFQIGVLFGPDQESISMERVEMFLKKAINVASERTGCTPNQLVRIVHNNKVIWLTQQQAADFLETGLEPDVQKEVERVLRGDLKYIRQELEILLAIAFYILNKYKENESIPQEDINRIEPGLQRRQREMKDGISNTTESEMILADKRRRNPLIDEYEQKMGEFLNLKAKGDLQRAVVLARELKEEKKRYLLLVRSIEPDVKTIYYHRLNLQKTKKKIISTQNELCSTRKDLLELQVIDLQNNIEAIQVETDTASEHGMDSASAEIKRLRTYDIDDVKKELTEKQREIQTLEKESAILERQENETQAVIEHIADTVLEQQDLKIDTKDIVRKASKPLFTAESKPVKEEPPKKLSGMHFSKSRNQ